MWIAVYYLRKKLPKLVVREISFYADPALAVNVDDPSVLHYAMKKGIFNKSLDLLLLNSAEKNQVNVIKYLLDQKADINYFQGKPIRNSFDSDCVGAFYVLLENGADVNSMSKYMFIHAFNSHPSIFTHFMHNGLNPEVCDLRQVRRENVELFIKTFPKKTLQLLKNFIKIDNLYSFIEYVDPAELNNLLIYAFDVFAGNSITCLVKQGANINVNGIEPLIMAIMKYNEKTVKSLIINKISLVPYVFNWRTFMWRDTDSAIKIIRILLDLKVEIQFIADDIYEAILTDRPLPQISKNMLTIYHVMMSARFSDFNKFKTLFDTADVRFLITSVRERMLKYSVLNNNYEIYKYIIEKLMPGSIHLAPQLYEELKL